MTQRLFTVFSAGLMLVAGGLAQPGPALAQSVTIALDSAPDMDGSGTYRWATVFSDTLKKEGFEVEAFPLNAIGGEDEKLDQVRSGLLSVSMSDFGRAAQLVPLMRAIQLPFTFDDPDHQKRFLQKESFLDDVNERMAASNARVLAVVPTGGFLGIFNNKHPVTSLADMADLRMRALDQAQLATIRMMGSNGVVIPFSEVPNALQTGIADGYFNAAGVPLLFGHTDLLSYFTDAQFSMSGRVALASTDWWDALDDDQKASVGRAVDAANEDVFAWVDGVSAGQIDQLKKAGFEVTELTPETRQDFIEALSDMRDTVADVAPADVAKVMQAVDATR